MFSKKPKTISYRAVLGWSHKYQALPNFGDTAVDTTTPKQVTTQQPAVSQLTGSYQTVRYLQRGEQPPPHPLLSTAMRKSNEPFRNCLLKNG